MEWREGSYIVRGNEVVSIRGDHVQAVRKAAVHGSGVDKLALRPAVGHSDDFGVRIARQDLESRGAPAATEILSCKYAFFMNFQDVRNLGKKRMLRLG